MEKLHDRYNHYGISEKKMADVANKSGCRRILPATFLAILTVIVLFIHNAVADGTWNVTGSMAVARRDHRATLLTDGKVLILGWLTNSAELYDPTTGTFNATGNTQYMHGQGVSATRLLDGRVLVVGGMGAKFSAEIYDPATGTFSATGAPNTPHIYHTATLLHDGRVLMAGGYNAMIPPLSSTVAELYDPATGSFTLTGSLNVDRVAANAALLPDGRVLISGGTRSTGPGVGYCLNSAELYDSVSGTFSLTTGSMIGYRCSLGFSDAPVLPNGKVLIVGGWYASAELFDPTTGTFSATGSMTTARGAPSVTLLPGGLVLVAGGSTAAGPVTTNSAELYDPAQGTFTATASMATARQEHTATLLLNGKVLVTGGWNPINYELSSSELFSFGNTPAGSNITVQPVDPTTGTTPVTITFTSVTTPGMTTVTTSSTGTPPPNGFRLGDPPTYYSIETTAGFIDSIGICINYSSMGFRNDSALKLFHETARGWEDVTTILDTVNDRICGTVSSLSLFGVFEPSYSFTGFLPPVENPPVKNTAKAGSTIPVKWQLVDGGGSYISDLSVVTGITFQQVQCSDLSTALTNEVPTTTSGSSGLHYDTAANQFIYNWKTEQSMAGNCYLLNLTLYEFNKYFAYFELK